MGGDYWVELEAAECLRLTPNGNLVVVVDGIEAVVPKRQLGDDNEVEEPGDCGTLVVPRWLAENEGWA